MEGLTIVLSQNGVDDLYDDDKAGGGHRNFWCNGRCLHIVLLQALEDDDPTSLSVGYTAGAISGSVATSDDGDASNVSISYAMGDITISAESDTDRTSS